MSAIVAEQLTKTYGPLTALDHVSFEVPQGHVLCVLGPNGAGKTTLLRILTTVSRPTSGHARIEGFDIQHQTLQVRQLIGVVAQDNHFDRYFSVWHNLTLHAKLHGMSADQYNPRIRSLLEQVNLYDRRNSLPEELSGGMQRRVALMRALIHEPKVLFLDEPTTGLDPQARLEIWETIEQLKADVTVILTTHYMEEADRLSDGIVMLNHGKIVAQGTARELKRAITSGNYYEVTLSAPKAEEYAQQIAQSHSEAASTLQVQDAFRLKLQITDPKGLEQLFTIIAPEDLEAIGKQEADLEDVFISIASARKQEER